MIKSSPLNFKSKYIFAFFMTLSGSASSFRSLWYQKN